MQITQNTLAEDYKLMAGERSPYLQRAREGSKLTIPSLMPEEGANAGSEYRAGFQSLGARLVNHLTSKIVLALLPHLKTNKANGKA